MDRVLLGQYRESCIRPFTHDLRVPRWELFQRTRVVPVLHDARVEVHVVLPCVLPMQIQIAQQRLDLWSPLEVASYHHGGGLGKLVHLLKGLAHMRPIPNCLEQKQLQLQQEEQQQRQPEHQAQQRCGSRVSSSQPPQPTLQIKRTASAASRAHDQEPRSEP